MKPTIEVPFLTERTGFSPKGQAFLAGFGIPFDRIILEGTTCREIDGNRCLLRLADLSVSDRDHPAALLFSFDIARAGNLDDLVTFLDLEESLMGSTFRVPCGDDIPAGFSAKASQIEAGKPGIPFEDLTTADLSVQISLSRKINPAELVSVIAQAVTDRYGDEVLGLRIDP